MSGPVILNSPEHRSDVAAQENLTLSPVVRSVVVTPSAFFHPKLPGSGTLCFFGQCSVQDISQ